MNGFFITGTDTGIGKTALGALLLAELRRRGINAAPMKPAQTGCELRGSSSERSVPDLDYSLSMTGLAVSEEDYALMAPYCFEPACSPHLAAEMAGTGIELETLSSTGRELAAEYDRIIVEGSGGILVPINRRETMLDLMKALGLPVLLASRPGLGTINHTLLSIRTLRNAGLEIAGIILVETQKTQSGLIEEDNITTIGQFGNVPILGKIPYCSMLRDPAPCYENLPVPVVAEIEKIVNKLTI